MPAFKTRQEQSEYFAAHGLKGYEGKFIKTFRLRKRVLFTVSYGETELLNQAPYFFTQSCELNRRRDDYNTFGQAQKELLIDGPAREFWEKWDGKHMNKLTIKQYDELMIDLDALSLKYPSWNGGSLVTNVRNDRIYSR